MRIFNEAFNAASKLPVAVPEVWIDDEATKSYEKYGLKRKTRSLTGVDHLGQACS